MARITSLAAFAAMCSLASAQAGPNTLAQYNPSQRTISSNATYCILPISKEDAADITGYAPLDIPVSVLPSFPAGMHPLIVQAGYNNDIRMSVFDLLPLQIPALMGGGLFVPFVDVTEDGQTAISVTINTYIGGIDGQDLQALVPALAANVPLFEGTPTFPASFVPDTAAVQTLPGGIYSIQAKPFLLPNTISGPGVYAEAFDMLYELTDDSPYTEETFQTLINNPQLLNTGKCQSNTLYFNETFTFPKMAVGNVTLFHQILSTPPAAIEGQYTNVYCYQANAQQVGSVAKSCAA